ncbi:pilus assembly protein [Sphingomonas sp. BGYR3]|uniref:TadE/TadG family type IV pilus assembly protein n=1 Tax=Sphingomonas sp. BGYR3 TaxID=2975483 RepID=UPI0021A65B08|nr:TadE family protein [Sphingomonas sp. BGYR3]MDG5487479.1 pilus assembly protein [Sphingomonas sp. BGYR3]
MAAVEFALVAPVMLMLICGGIEMAHLTFARSTLDAAMIQAARKASASLETAEATRTSEMIARINTGMNGFPIAPDHSTVIETRVYRNFSAAYPEVFTDTNGNGSYELGEPYVDRNGDGVWNPATPKPNRTLGGPGDVVSYTVRYPKRILFKFLAQPLGLGDIITISATTVVRNEAVVRRT